MILTKNFNCTIDDLDSIAVALAKEIENGWHIFKIEQYPMKFSNNIRSDEPEFSIELCRKDKYKN